MQGISLHLCLSWPSDNFEKNAIILFWLKIKCATKSLPFEFLPYLTTLPSHTHISTLTVKPIKFYNQANLSPLFKEHDLTAKVLNMKSFKTLCTFSKIIKFFTTSINLLYKPFNFLLFEISVFFFFFDTNNKTISQSKSLSPIYLTYITNTDNE